MTAGHFDRLEALQRAHPKLNMLECADNSWIPAGWARLVDDLCTRIEAQLSKEELLRFRITQIKEKFGTLRFHCVPYAPVSAIVIDAEWQSGRICQDCGGLAAS